MRHSLIALFAASVAVPAWPADPAATPQEPEEEQALLSIIEQETELATRSKLNRDYVPGMVTVLRGEELEELGVRTVLEALSLVPGVQVFRELSGAPNLSLRGIAYPFNAGNSQVLLNSVAISREDAGVNSAALLTRIEQVDRIEVMRGPGSSLHGAFAFAGVINIITRDSGTRIFAGADSDDTRSLGLYASRSGTDQRWHASFNAAGLLGSQGEGPAGTDPDASGATSVARLERGGFALVAEHLARDQDLTLPGGIPLNAKERSLAIEARQQWSFGRALDGSGRATYLHNELVATDSGKRFNGDLWNLEFDLDWKPSARHRVLLGVSAADSRIDHASLLLPPPPLPPLLRSLLDQQDRSSFGITLQDQLEIGSRTSVTLGLRSDSYQAVGSRLTPRVGLVFRASEHHVLKAQYAEGFRPPTFWEVYAPGFRSHDLRFEVIRTLEAGYAYRRANLVGRVTVFHSRIDDMLYLVLPPPGPGPTVFDNNSTARTTGVELELEGTLAARLHWFANLSTAATDDTRSTSGPDGDSAGAADVLANLGLSFRPTPRQALAIRLLHVGRRHTLAGQTDGYDALDLTASLLRFPTRRWTLRAGVRNALDQSIVYLLALPTATREVNFVPRSAWMEISASF